MRTYIKSLILLSLCWFALMSLGVYFITTDQAYANEPAEEETQSVPEEGFDAVGIFKKFVNALAELLSLDETQVAQVISSTGSATDHIGPVGSEKIMNSLADPAIVYFSKRGKYILSGTNEPTTLLSFYESSDGKNFSLVSTLNPSDFDKYYKYCHIWAPDLVEEGSNLTVYFSATRVNKNVECNSDHVRLVSPFKTTVGVNLNSMTSPVALDYSSTGGPKSNPVGENEMSMRIDTMFFIDPVTRKNYIYYTWLKSGNHISSYNITDQAITYNRVPKKASDETINEAPDIFYHNGWYYLIYSRGGYDQSYGLSYIKAKSPNGLNTSLTENNILDPVFDTSVRRGCHGYSGNKILSAGGHSDTISINGTWYIYYHMNKYSTSSSGCQVFTGRDIYRSKLEFDQNGDILNLRDTQLSWKNLGNGYTYSLDVIDATGKTYAPCVEAGILGNRTSYAFNGTCGNGTSAIIPAMPIKARICGAYNSNWQSAQCGPYVNVTGSSLTLPLPDPTTLNWKNLGNGYTYSLDVIDATGKTYAPCVEAGILGNRTSYAFNGTCGNGTSAIIPAMPVKARICAAYNGNWQSALCGSYANVTGSSLTLPLSLTPAPEPDSNILPNPGMETQRSGNVPLYWGGGAQSTIKNLRFYSAAWGDARSGKYYSRLQAPGNQMGWVWVNQPGRYIDVGNYSEVEYSVYVRYSGLKNVLLELKEYDSTGKEIRRQSSPNIGNGQWKWHYGKHAFKLSPETKRVTFAIIAESMNLTGSSTLYLDVDDASVVRK